MWKWKGLKCNKHTSYVYFINYNDSNKSQWKIQIGKELE